MPRLKETGRVECQACRVAWETQKDRNSQPEVWRQQTWCVGAALQGVLLLCMLGIIFLLIRNVLITQFKATATYWFWLICCVYGAAFFQTSQAPVGGDGLAPKQLPVGRKQGC